MDLLDDDGLIDLERGQKRATDTDPHAVTKEIRSAKAPIPERNKALGAWAERLGQGGTYRDVAATSSEECHLCTATGRSECKQCGRRACASHFWVMFGLCRSCASEDRVKAWHGSGEAEDTNWLRDA